MKAPGILRRRGPFLTPFWVAGAAALVAVGLVYLVARATIAFTAETTTVVVLRHAEKGALPAGDPGLTPQGEARAQRLAHLFASAPLAAVYASDTQRAQRTAAPLAARHRLPVTVRAGKDIDGLLEDIGRRFVGRTVLVVGHSDTVPRIVDALSRGRSRVTLGDGEFDRVFVVTVTRYGPSSVTELRY